MQLVCGGHSCKLRRLIENPLMLVLNASLLQSAHWAELVRDACWGLCVQTTIALESRPFLSSSVGTSEMPQCLDVVGDELLSIPLYAETMGYFVGTQRPPQPRVITTW